MLANPAFHEKPSARLGSKKTRTGCVKCKHARVKCDENKPKCKRCARLGLQCGYRDLFLLMRACPQRSSSVEGRGHHWNVSPAFQLPAFEGDGTERRLFDFYRSEVALRLGGFLDRDFWYTTILRLAHSEQVILYSIIAIAAAFKHLRYLADEATDLPSDLVFIYYQRALKEANRRTQQGDCELVIMLTCPIFLCMEFLQGNKLQAMALFRHGHGLLQSLVDRRQLAKPRTSQLGDIDQTFYAVFERLTLMSKMFGLDVKLTSFPGQNLRDEPLSGAKFSSLEEARNSLVRRLLIGREFMKTICGQSQPADFSQNLTVDDRREHERLISQQQQWYDLFLDLCQHLAPRNAAEAAMTATLTIFHFVAIIWLNCPLDGSQMSFDAYLNHFQVIVAQVRAVIDICNDDSKLDGIFTFETGVLPALYFTATKCRHLETRNQALELIKKAPKREGPWKRDELIEVAGEAIRLECAKLRTADEWPSEADRIVKIKISQHDDDSCGKVAFLYENHVVTKTWTDL